MSKNNGNDDHKNKSADEPEMVRLSGYLSDEEKSWWLEECDRVAELEDIRNVSVGMLFSRIAKAGLRLDQATLAQYAKLNPKRERKQTAARR